MTARSVDLERLRARVLRARGDADFAQAEAASAEAAWWEAEADVMTHDGQMHRAALYRGVAQGCRDNAVLLQRSAAGQLARALAVELRLPKPAAPPVAAAAAPSMDGEEMMPWAEPIDAALVEVP